jgi:branched-chain amino acid transport system substrate-binding protein
MKIVGGLIGSLALTISVELASAQTIKIGMMLPFSGVSADLGDAQVKGFDLYVKLHAKDLEPYKVDIVRREEGPPSGAIAKTVATELITIDKVKLITGVVGSPSAIAMAPVITQAKVPLITSNAGTAWITNLSPYIVRFSFACGIEDQPLWTAVRRSVHRTW